MKCFIDGYECHSLCNYDPAKAGGMDCCRNSIKQDLFAAEAHGSRDDVERLLLELVGPARSTIWKASKVDEFCKALDAYIDAKIRAGTIIINDVFAPEPQAPPHPAAPWQSEHLTDALPYVSRFAVGGCTCETCTHQLRQYQHATEARAYAASLDVEREMLRPFEVATREYIVTAYWQRPIWPWNPCQICGQVERHANHSPFTPAGYGGHTFQATMK